ncbi:hypothetical protein [uncultured Psychroserpens sp.]|uniref:hypothetical protein n=1 Tax=uncultured Psychroserpens sp. TaxID=255436 RepID=UPI0026270C1C|nr:hypothetical protein [uncultured Psychroserpens sp.]
MSVVLSFKIRKYYALVVVALLCLNTAFAQDDFENNDESLRLYYDELGDADYYTSINYIEHCRKSN